ncbi:MAG: dienelactone hydrolase family protein [Phycisphaeraceae bacterium]
MPPAASAQHTEVHIATPNVTLPGNLDMPENATGLVVFAHGSGSSRFSPRNCAVAESLQDRGLATLLFDLLTEREDEIDQKTRAIRFDVKLLGQRLAEVVDWVRQQDNLASLPVGLFGASTGAAAALIAAAARPDSVHAIVSRGGRPDLADDALPRVQSPTLLIVGGLDTTVIDMNQTAAEQMDCENQLEIVEGASHLFEEPGKLDEVASLAGEWFTQKLKS